MADTVRIELSAQDEATNVIRNLANELRKLQLTEESYRSGFRKFEGVSAYQAQTAAIKEQITAVKELSAAQQQAQRFMQSQSMLAAGRAEGVLFPKENVENVHGYTRALEEAGNAGEGGANKTAQGLRHVVALFDEFNRGQRGAMIASFSAMVRDLGAVEAAVKNITGPLAAIGITGAAAIGLFVIAIRNAHSELVSLRDTQATLALQGAGASPQQAIDITSTYNANRAATDEWRKTQTELDLELNKLPAAARSSIPAFQDLAKGLAGFKQEEPAKAIEAYVKAAHQGPEAVGKLAESALNLRGVINSSGMTLEAQLRTLTSTEEKYRAVTKAVQEARGPVIEVGKEAHTAQENWWGYAFALMGTADAQGNATKLSDDLINKMQKAVQPLKDVTLATEGVSNATRDLNEIFDRANKVLDDRIEALGKLAKAQTGVSGVPGAETLNDPRTQERNENALRNMDAEQRKSRLQPAEEEDHQRRMSNINAEAEAHRANLALQTEAAQKRLDEAKRVAEIRFPGGDTSKDVEVQRASEAVEEAKRKQSDETRRTQIDNFREVVAEDARGGQARIKAQEDVIAKTREGVAADRIAPEQIGRELIKLANLRRELANKTFQEARDFAREEVELAKGNVDQILAAYAKLSGAAVRTGQAPTVNAQIEREKVRDLESAQSQAFTRLTEFNSSMERQGNLQIQAERARLQVQVSQHAMSKDQMAQAEANFTQQVMAEEERRVEAELKTIGLTEAQRSRLYDHLAELYQKDAEKQLQAQEKVTAAIEAENTKKLKSFQTMFDSVGTGMERLVDAAITRSETRQKAFQQFGQSVVKSLVTEIGHVGSQYAGKGIASALGVKTEGMTDTSIGSVLSRAIGDKLGLTKESTGQEALKGVSEKMQKASDAQAKATESFKTSVADFAKASQALLNAADKRGVQSGFSRGGSASNDNQISLDSTPSSQASVAVSQALTHTGEKLKNYCAILVNEALEKAGVSGSGSGLASSFKNYGTSVSPGDVRKGDVFYSPPSGWGDTGHVGLTTGAVQGGRVPVMSSHMQGDPSNPAGEETRDVSNLTFRRPPYNEQIKVDPSSVAQGVSQGTQEASSTTQSAVQQGVTEGSSQQVSADQQLGDKLSTLQQTSDQQKQAITQNTQALGQNTQKQGGTGTSATTSSSMSSNLGLLTQGLGIAASAAAIFGRQLSPAVRMGLGAIGVLTQLSGFVKTAGSSLGLFGDAAKATTSVTTLLQGANTANTVATTLNTTATTTNSAAQTTSAAGSGIGGILKGIPLLGMLFEHGGIVPSAAGGMISGGGLSILHPREMVLPAHLSTGLQNMINRGSANDNRSSPVLNYNANVTGYHPYSSKSSFDALLRQHGNALMGHVENAVRNGWRA